VFEQDQDEEFVQELYPQIVKQHNWWYTHRDHDEDGICEYGSTDGSLMAAKWESGMDNAVRFDSSQMVQNGPGAFSLNQESVDLNAYLFAEKQHLTQMATVLGKAGEAAEFQHDADALKKKIQTQFYDPNTNWFYDTTLDGETHILAMGCEGWLPLWAKAATSEQAEAVKNNMMNPAQFNTAVPFQTLSAAHPKFKPDGGYWRGPNWLDQSYFGVMGLHNYGHHQAAYEATYKLFHNADGALLKGNSIRENYQPMTGAGLEAENFSWSAAHYLLLLLNE
jgi:putative isomerase